MKSQSLLSRNLSSIVTIVLIILIMIIFSAIIVRNPWRDSGRAPSPASEESAAAGETDPSAIADGAEGEAGDEPIEIPAATYVPARLSHLDPEYFENKTETNGIIIGGTVIAVLIFFSVLVLLVLERIRDNEVHEK